MRERGENGDMTDERGTTEPGGTAATQTAEEARKRKARELNELIRYTMWSVFRVADRAGLDAGGREAAAAEVTELLDQGAGKGIVTRGCYAGQGLRAGPV